MARRLFRLALLLVCVIGIVSAAEPSIDEYVAKFNPNLYAGAEAAPMESTFTAPGSNIAHEVNDYFWFSMIVFLPFLVLPQILLLYVIFKFRQRKNDGRKASTWVHNTKLEIAWTLIPVVALIIVGIPAFPLLYRMELAPENIDGGALQINVTGRQFAWDYEYKHEGVKIGQDLVSSQQESLVLPVGRTVALGITSNDVNHAWWIPAFGVKKDAIMGRFNSCWFTPDRVGFFKGQCAELCGQSHGKMVIGAAIVEESYYAKWLVFQANRNPAQKVWDALVAWTPGSDDKALRETIAGYRTKTGGTADADQSLRYWVAYNGESYTRKDPGGLKDSPEFAEWQANQSNFAARKAKVGEILAALASIPQQQEAHVMASVEE
jgi:cytochrome c oxidase subunit II